MATRREFLRKMLLGGSALVLQQSLLRAAELAAPQKANSMNTARPNIIWIYCDELRTDALGSYGHPTLKLHTPHLDRLAAEGVRFTNNFCNSPVCVPSRVCVKTSLYPEETGVYNNEADWKNFRLPRTLETFPQVFARNGYRTANFGKMHVARGMYPGETPGYDIFQKHNGAGGDMGFWLHLGEKGVQMIRSYGGGGMNGGIFPDGEPYPPEKVTENALQWMAAAESPYLVRLSILQPHTPVLPPARFVKLYDGQDPGLPGPLPETMSAFERRVASIHKTLLMDPEKLRACRLHYYAQVAWVDSQVGRVLEYLDRTGQRENTIILFGADHGTPIGDTGAFEKHTFTPCVHRVPLIVSMPGTLAPGQVREDICDSLDVGPTLLALSGIASPAQFRGRDLFSAKAPEAIYSTIGYGKPDSKMGPNGGRGQWFGDRGWPRRSCIRTARYRLDKNMLIDTKPPTTPEDIDLFLADVVNDPREVKNLANDPQYADVVKDLSAKLDEHAKGAVDIPAECLVR